MKSATKWLGFALLLLVVLGSMQRELAAQAEEPSFAWFAELVSVDQAARTVTARAPIEAHVARYIGRFKQGERITMVWSQLDAEGDIVRYVERAETMEAESGYIVHAEYVASDVGRRTLTFSTPVPDTVVETLASAGPGTPIKIESPMWQAGSATSVALNERPRPRPEPVLVEDTPDWDGVDVAGEWALNTSLMGNDLTLSCAFTQAGPTLGGDCTGPPPLDEMALEGNVDGHAVTFKIEADVGMTLILLHTGELNPEGTVIEGTLDMMGNVSSFKIGQAVAEAPHGLQRSALRDGKPNHEAEQFQGLLDPDCGRRSSSLVPVQSTRLAGTGHWSRRSSSETVRRSTPSCGRTWT